MATKTNHANAVAKTSTTVTKIKFADAVANKTNHAKAAASTNQPGQRHGNQKPPSQCNGSKTRAVATKTMQWHQKPTTPMLQKKTMLQAPTPATLKL